MKKIFLVFAVLFSMLASCSEEDNGCETCPGTEMLTLRLNFHTNGFTSMTRGFFDNTPVAEPWEKEIRSLMIYIFDLRNREKAVYFKWVTSREGLDYMTIDVELPVELPVELIGAECEILVAANNQNKINMTYDQVLEISEYRGISGYQSDFNSISSKCIRTEGFCMSGRQTFTVIPGQTISVELRRTVAKLAIKTFINPEILKKYDAKAIFLRGIKLDGQFHSMCPFNESGYGERYMIYQRSEYLSGSYGNLFYIYPDLSMINHPYCQMIFVVTLDKDGDPETLHDQTDYLLYYKPEYSGNGQVIRNGYYRFSVTINGIESNGKDPLSKKENDMITVVME